MKKVYRADSYYKTVEHLRVDDCAPVGIELPPLFGNGVYIYFETEGEAKDWLFKEILTEIQGLLKKLKQLSK